MTAESNYKRLGCISFECAGEHKAKGLCATHYMRMKRTGSSENLRVGCAYCHKSFKAQRQNSMYCSNTCKVDAWRHTRGLKPASRRKIAPSPFCNVFFKVCESCALPFTTRWESKVTCSEACRKDRASAMPAFKVCRCCGANYTPVFTGGGLGSYCGEACAQLVNKAVKRIGKAKRRAVLINATVERVDPFRVFERDKWRCALRGVRTPKAKRGTYADNAPELDHINPLSRGGDHSYINTQCACRKCNGLKSDTPKGQTLMFG